MSQMFKVSASAIDEFTTCRRKYYLDRVRNIQPTKRPDALDFGSAVHRGLASIFRSIANDSGNPENDMQIAREYALQQVNECCDEYAMDNEARCKALALVDSYIDFYYLEDRMNFDVLAVEQYFANLLNKLETGVEVVSHGVFDTVVKNKHTGEIFVIEHKTTGMMGDNYIDNKRIDYQGQMYMHACSDKYGQCNGVIYDIISKPRHSMNMGETDEEFQSRLEASKTGKIKRKEAETKEQFIGRIQSSFDENTFTRELVPCTSELTDVINDVSAISEEIRYCRNYYKCPSNCLKFGACPYMDLCAGKANIDNLGDKYINCDTGEVKNE